MSWPLLGSCSQSADAVWEPSISSLSSFKVLHDGDMTAKWHRFLATLLLHRNINKTQPLSYLRWVVEQSYWVKSLQSHITSNQASVICRPLLICVRVLIVGPSWTTTAWRQVGFHQATSTVTLQSPVVTHELRLLHAKFLTAKFSHLNYFQSISKCKKTQCNHWETTNFSWLHGDVCPSFTLVWLNEGNT